MKVVKFEPKVQNFDKKTKIREAPQKKKQRQRKEAKAAKFREYT